MSSILEWQNERQEKDDGQNDGHGGSWRELHEGKYFARKSRCCKEICVSSGILYVSSVKYSSGPSSKSMLISRTTLTSGKSILRNLMMLSIHRIEHCHRIRHIQAIVDNGTVLCIIGSPIDKGLFLSFKWLQPVMLIEKLKLPSGVMVVCHLRMNIKEKIS